MSETRSSAGVTTDISNPQKLRFRDLSDIRDGKNLYLVNEGGVDFDFYLHRKTEKANRLHVVLPGAGAWRPGQVTYARQDWSDRFQNSHFASICDPTVTPENKLMLGWFQHSASFDCQAALSKCILRLSRALGIASANVTIFGSSGGGFSALQMHKYLPYATIIAINPQIQIQKFKNHNLFTNMLQLCYPEETEESAVLKYRARMVVEPQLAARKAPIFIFQNLYDPSHLKGHVLPMLEGLCAADFQVVNIEKEPLKKATPLNVLLYEDANAKHNAPGINTYLRYFNMVLKLPKWELPSPG